MTHLMTHLIPANVPLYYRCVVRPVRWLADGHWLVFDRGPQTLKGKFQRLGTATDFDPWEKRREFFALNDTDPEKLVAFLSSTGEFTPGLFPGKQSGRIPVQWVWEFRNLLRRCMTEKAELNWDENFEVLLEGAGARSRVVFTTNTLLDSLMLTIAADRLMKAKIQKCRRPDCGVLFANATGHDKKFCCWECGHLESVRRQRRKEKVRKAKTKRRKA